MRRVFFLIILVLLAGCSKEQSEEKQGLVLVYTEEDHGKDDEDLMKANFINSVSEQKNYLYGFSVDLDQDGDLEPISFFSDEHYESLIKYTLHEKSNQISLMGKIISTQIGDINDDQKSDILIEVDLGGSSGSREYLVLHCENDELQTTKVEDFLNLCDYELCFEKEQLLFRIENSELIYKIDKTLLHETYKISSNPENEIMIVKSIYMFYEGNDGKVIEKVDYLRLNHKLMVLGEVHTTYRIDNGNSYFMNLSFSQN